jgi:hypothetical protein
MLSICCPILPFWNGSKHLIPAMTPMRVGAMRHLSGEGHGISRQWFPFQGVFRLHLAAKYNPE